MIILGSSAGRIMSRIRRCASRAAAAFTIGLLWVTPAAAAQPARSEPPHTAHAQTFGGTRTVGALFPPDSAFHLCTASVIASPRGDVILTAAHCIDGSGAGDVFIPGYRNGLAPLGTWTVVSSYAPEGWLTKRSPRDDYAFAVVAPQRRDGHIEQIQSVTGANRLGSVPQRGEEITVPAYPAGSGGSPITCTTRTYAFGSFPAFNCTPYVGGTSGAPWLHRSGRGWTVVGIIGGPYEGGCHPWTSYSPVLDRSATRLLATIDRGTPSVVPPPVSAC